MFVPFNILQIEEELNPKVQFKARPADVLRREAFIPEKSTKPLTGE